MTGIKHSPFAYAVRSTERGGRFFAQRASLSFRNGRCLCGSDYHSDPCPAVVVLVVCSGGRLDRIWIMVSTLLLKGVEDEGDRFPAAAVSGKNYDTAKL